MGCHMAALDWATWHLYNQPNHATCQPLIGPRHLPLVNHRTAMSTLPFQMLIICATCHPSSDDTCHLRIGPIGCAYVQNCLTRVASWCFHVSPSGIAMCHLLELPHHLYGLYSLHSHHNTWTVWTVHSSPFFTCLAFQTEHDIFSIRSPFDKVNIPPELGRRDRRNGIGFVAFQELYFLSIFQALSGFWIRFWITPPHNKTFWSPKGY
jgi:hypothetical protein